MAQGRSGICYNQAEVQARLNQASLPYQIEEFIAEGGYGVVYSAVDRRSPMSEPKEVAIKVFKETAFRSAGDIQRIFREIVIMTFFAKQTQVHPNVVRILDLVPFTPGDRTIIYVMEKMDSDLLYFCGERIHQSLKYEFIRSWMYQLLQVLAYLHKARVVDRDIKPENIFINTDGLKISDFGSGRFLPSLQAGSSTTPEQPNPAVDYAKNQPLSIGVSNVQYAAPEQTNSTNLAYYSEKVDVWAAGCVFGRLLNGGKLLFKNEKIYPHLRDLVKVLGVPEVREGLRAIGCNKETLADFPTFEREIQEKMLVLFDWNQLRSPDGVDITEAKGLLRHMLRVNPAQRLSFQEALQHDFFKPYQSQPLEIFGEMVNYEKFNLDESELFDFPLSEEVRAIMDGQFEDPGVILQLIQQPLEAIRNQLLGLN